MNTHLLISSCSLCLRGFICQVYHAHRVVLDNLVALTKVTKLGTGTGKTRETALSDHSSTVRASGMSSRSDLDDNIVFHNAHIGDSSGTDEFCTDLSDDDSLPGVAELFISSKPMVQRAGKGFTFRDNNTSPLPSVKTSSSWNSARSFSGRRSASPLHGYSSRRSVSPLHDSKRANESQSEIAAQLDHVRARSPPPVFEDLAMRYQVPVKFGMSDTEMSETRLSIGFFTQESELNSQTLACTLPHGIQGVRLGAQSVQASMRVYVNAQFADPKTGLYGDTVACDGRLGVVEQCDQSETCKLRLADGRLQWVQCQALISMDQAGDLQLEALTGTSNIATSLRNISTLIESKIAVTPALQNLVLKVHANDADGVRASCADLALGEIDGLVDGCGLLHVAVEFGYLEVVTILLTAGANPNLRDAEENTPMHWAFISEDHAEGAAVTAALIEAGANINAQNKLGLTPLHIAAGKGHLVGTEILIAMNCQVDIPTFDTNETSIFYAMKALSTEILKLLVEQGACNINVCDGDGDTPLHLSFYMARRLPDFIQVSEYLIQHGANAASMNQHGVAAIDYCPEEFRERVKEVFVSVRVAKLKSMEFGAEIKPGDRVKLRPGMSTPAYGFQGVTEDDLLVVRHVEDGVVQATFVDPNIMLQFDEQEMYLVYDTSGTLLTTSSAQDDAVKMFDVNSDSFWQSDGERGKHWIMLELPDVVDVLALEVLPHRGGVAFIPKKCEVQIGEHMGQYSVHLI